MQTSRRWPAVLVSALLLLSGCGLAQSESDAIPGSPAATTGPRRCPTPPSSGPGGLQYIIDYVDGVTLGGRQYQTVHPTGTPVVPGPVLTTTLCRIASANDPEARSQDRDAVLLAPGTVLREVPGFDPGFRLAADTPGGPVLYEAWRPAATARTGADVFPGVAAHVVALVGTSIRDGRELARTADPATVNDFLGALLAAPVQLDRRDLSPEAQGSIALVLDDGTVVRRAYHARDGVLGPGLTLPPSARRIAESLLPQ